MLLAMAVIPGHAMADWIDPGIAYRCNKAEGVFGMMATMATSSPETPGEVQVADGYVSLSKEKDEFVLLCQVGQAQAKAIIRIVRARERGRCSAFDFLEIKRLEINNRVLSEHAQFSSGCHSDPVLHRVEIRTKGEGLLLRTCKAAWMWDTGYSPETCEERLIPIHRAVKRKMP